MTEELVFPKGTESSNNHTTSASDKVFEERDAGHRQVAGRVSDGLTEVDAKAVGVLLTLELLTLNFCPSSCSLFLK